MAVLCYKLTRGLFLDFLRLPHLTLNLSLHATFSDLDALDFSTMEFKLENNRYNSLSDFLQDAKLVFSNCRTYNQDGSNYVRSANRLEKFLKDLLNDLNAEN